MPNATWPVVDGFKGLNNRIDPIRLGLEWQLQADNVLCDDAGFLTRRPGQTSFVNSQFKDVYGTKDGRLLAIDASDNLIQIDEQGNSLVLQAGVIGAPFQWTELGYAIFMLGDVAAWAVYPDTIITLGSLCPSLSSVSYPLGDPISYPPPGGHVIGTRRDQLAVAVWEDEQDRSVLYFSRPGYPHEFRLERDYQIFAGRINLLAHTSTAFVIGTDRAIYLDPYDGPMMKVADYGVPLNAITYDERDVVFFWSELGLCKAAPFENLTDSKLAVIGQGPVTMALLEYQGSRYAVVQQVNRPAVKRSARPYELPTVSVIG